MTEFTKFTDTHYRDNKGTDYFLRAGQTPEGLLADLSQRPDTKEPTTEERFDSMFPKTDTAQVLFEVIFELSNRIMTLEGKNNITREHLKDWLKSKLPT